MRTPGWVVLATVLAVMMVGPVANAADQTPPPKPGVVTPQTAATNPDDMFSPPLRGTPGGRISGGTRGLHPVGPGAPKPAPLSSAGSGASMKTTQEAQLPVAH
jgi:hypothetical protein